MYVLARFSDCREFYRGQHQGDSTFVVGRGTDEERCFKRKDLQAASDYAKQMRLPIESLPNSSLCADGVRELWGEL